MGSAWLCAGQLRLLDGDVNLRKGNDTWCKQSPDPARWRRRVANGKSIAAMRVRRKPEAKARADEQVCPASEAMEGRQMRRGKTGTNLQHKMKSSIHQMAKPLISDCRPSKVAGNTPGRAVASVCTIG